MCGRKCLLTGTSFWSQQTVTCFLLTFVSCSIMSYTPFKIWVHEGTNVKSKTVRMVSNRWCRVQINKKIHARIIYLDALSHSLSLRKWLTSYICISSMFINLQFGHNENKHVEWINETQRTSFDQSGYLNFGLLGINNLMFFSSLITFSHWYTACQGTNWNNWLWNTLASTPVFIAALFAIAKTWKQPKRPSTDKWIRKRWYIYTTEYYTAIKKNEIMPFAAPWLDLEIIILSEVSQRKTNIIWYHLYMESKKIIQMNLFKKQK